MPLAKLEVTASTPVAFSEKRNAIAVEQCLQLERVAQAPNRADLPQLPVFVIRRPGRLARLGLGDGQFFGRHNQSAVRDLVSKGLLCDSSQGRFLPGEDDQLAIAHVAIVFGDAQPFPGCVRHAHSRGIIYRAPAN
jgi:hypothetical protein